MVGQTLNDCQMEILRTFRRLHRRTITATEIKEKVNATFEMTGNRVNHELTNLAQKGLLDNPFYGFYSFTTEGKWIASHL